MVREGHGFQPCRKGLIIMRALAPEVGLLSDKLQAAIL
jgi:hypothetical protein